MAADLKILGVPQVEQPTILDKLFEVIQVCRPERCIIVLIAEVTVSFLGSFDAVDRVTIAYPRISITIRFGDDDDPSEWCFEIYELFGSDYHGVIDTVILEPFEAVTPKFIPATRSSIESLQKVGFHSLEQATIKQISTCSICEDEFADGNVDQLITPLPCKHHFHADCISQWLEISHLCPLCRYALPTVEHGEPSNS
ncbi:putative transcription factor C2H2 family [Rosa chinensis]|uniref:RING-type E3 ubiquitin transferase n=1 Tax=Rosa chinensis TaxID=74649 RepID=A0A2P6S5R8_ROSCH|nr:putative transcription factor C2H2 family [Rosa chinensis]